MYFFLQFPQTLKYWCITALSHRRKSFASVRIAIIVPSGVSQSSIPLGSPGRAPFSARTQRLVLILIKLISWLLPKLSGRQFDGLHLPSQMFVRIGAHLS